MVNKYTIYSIRKQKNKDRVFVNFSDHDEPLVLSMDLVLKHKLQKNMILSEHEFDIISKEQSLINSKQAAYNFAAYKPRSEMQVREKLKKESYSKDLINISIDFLYEFNLLNDERFASSFVSEKIKLKNFGPFRLRQELKSKGISEDIINKVLENAYSESEIDVAYKAAEKKLRALKNKPFEKRKNSLTSFLQRQGFDWDTIKEILEKINLNE